MDDRRVQFVRHLIATGSIASASKKMGFSLTTGYRMARNPLVRELFQEARRELFRIGMSRALGLLETAWDTLEQVARDTEASPGARVQASSEIIRFCRDAIEIDDLATRVRALEEAAGGRAPEASPGVEAIERPEPGAAA
ncbi:MAG: hypothetical protein JSS51_07680 [Planctomycetes bacterium]|nr:hypothetical protein [Planctomycetota bacterium]